MIKNPVEWPIEVNNANIRQTPDEIPIPKIDKGLLLIFEIMISAITYPAIYDPPIIYWLINILKPALLKFNDVK
jgi:hypothetical protein